MYFSFVEVPIPCPMLFSRLPAHHHLKDARPYEVAWATPYHSRCVIVCVMRAQGLTLH